MDENPYEAQENERQARGEYEEQPDLCDALARSIRLVTARRREQLAYAKLQEINALQVRAAEFWEQCCAEMYELEAPN
jgi:hypothetical protein